MAFNVHISTTSDMYISDLLNISCLPSSYMTKALTIPKLNICLSNL